MAKGPIESIGQIGVMFLRIGHEINVQWSDAQSLLTRDRAHFSGIKRATEFFTFLINPHVDDKVG